MVDPSPRQDILDWLEANTEKPSFLDRTLGVVVIDWLLRRMTPVAPQEGVIAEPSVLDRVLSAVDRLCGEKAELAVAKIISIPVLWLLEHFPVHDSWSPPQTPEEQRLWQLRMGQLEDIQRREGLN